MENSRHGRSEDELIDVVWTLTSPEVFDRLVRRSGWQSASYEAWLSVQLEAALTYSARVDGGWVRP